MTPAALAAFAARALDGATRAWSAEEFADLLGQHSTILSKTTDAFALGRFVAGEAELLLIATAPERRRTGAARACLATFEDTCRSHGAKAVFLEVSQANTAALALYAAAGYAQVGARPDYYRTPQGGLETALVLRKALGRADDA
ncbi:MAG: GNAT family N-acetyltransferase [Pseudomonadota bacterium]